MGPLSEKRCAQLGKNAIAQVGNRRWENPQHQVEKTEFGQAVDDFADRRTPDQKILTAIFAPFRQHHRFDIRYFRVGLDDALKGLALLGAVAHPVCMISLLHPVDPTIAERALAVEKEEQRVLCGSQGFPERWGGSFAHASNILAQCDATAIAWLVLRLMPGGKRPGEQLIEEARRHRVHVLHVGPNDHRDDEGDQLSLPVVQQGIFHRLYFAEEWRLTGSGVRRW